MKVLVVLACVLACQPCSSRSVDEESVVSVYTTLPSSGAGAPSLDVYHQIANNIAERITSPIYRFFGFNSTEATTTRRPFERVELPKLSDNDLSKNVTDKPVTDRDVEELSVEALQKPDKKPEKIVLFSSYLPAKENYEKNDNDTSLELDDLDDTFVDVGDASTPRGPLVFILEFFGSIIQLLYGAFAALFSPSTSKSEED